MRKFSINILSAVRFIVLMALAVPLFVIVAALVSAAAIVAVVLVGLPSLAVCYLRRDDCNGRGVARLDNQQAGIVVTLRAIIDDLRQLNARMDHQGGGPPSSLDAAYESPNSQPRESALPTRHGVGGEAAAAS